MEECSLNCPEGNDDCPWLAEIRHNFRRAVEAVAPPKDEYGRCVECSNTGWAETRNPDSRVAELEPCRCKKGAVHSVGMPGFGGKRRA